jgi:5-hydroxyisourate hydrolase-like protein (transthyretin family)
MTIGDRWCCLLGLLIVLSVGCGRPALPQAKDEPETLSRTEFTDRIENFFEHDPLTPSKPSRFLIHLTDLSDGSPVEKADVTLTVRPDGAEGTGTTAKAKVGRVTGIYVAEVTVPGPGGYRIDFHVRNAKLDERMSLAEFRAQ